MEDVKISKAYGVRVASMNDLARLAASSVAMGQITYVVRIFKDEEVIYAVLAVFRDYYRLYGIPIIYYYVDTERKYPVDGNYLLVKADSEGEIVEIGKGGKPGYVVVPIINLAEIPDFLPFSK